MHCFMKTITCAGGSLDPFPIMQTPTHVSAGSENNYLAWRHVLPLPNRAHAIRMYVLFQKFTTRASDFDVRLQIRSSYRRPVVNARNLQHRWPWCWLWPSLPVSTVR